MSMAVAPGMLPAHGGFQRPGKGRADPDERGRDTDASFSSEDEEEEERGEEAVVRKGEEEEEALSDISSIGASSSDSSSIGENSASDKEEDEVQSKAKEVPGLGTMGLESLEDALPSKACRRRSEPGRRTPWRRWRVQDPVYGSAGIIDRLQQEISAALATTRAELAMRAGMLEAPQPGAQPPPPATIFLPAPSPAAAEVRSGGRLLAGQHREEEEAPVMDTDVFLGLGDL